jgi:CHAD domain-containing protein
VGLRRARVALTVFAPVLDEEQTKRTRRTLREAFRALGPVRERDVLAADVVASFARGRNAAAAKQLVHRLRQERSAARKDALAIVGSRPFERAVSGLDALVVGPEASADEAGEAPSLRAWANARVLALAAQLEIANARERCDAETHHALRKELKRLRFALEFFQDLLPPRLRTALLSQVLSVLDLLGALQDVVSARALLERHPGSHRYAKVDAAFLDTLRARLDRRERSVRAALPRALSKLEPACAPPKARRPSTAKRRRAQKRPV